MEIEVAKYAGFCYGVKNAVSVALSCSNTGAVVLGELIHNARVTQALQRNHIGKVESLDEVKAGETVIIRSHGAPKCIFDACAARGITVVDATCPFVKKIHGIVEKYHHKGYQIVIVGEAMHPEVQGINGWCENAAVIVNSVEEAQALQPQEKMCIVAQTTYKTEKYEEILKVLAKFDVKMLEIFNTICYTTSKRQKEALAMAKRCDCILVVGDRNSSNTNKLYEIAAANCEHVYFITKADDVKSLDINLYEKVGVVAGASAPEVLIMEVVKTMTEQMKEEKAMTMEDVMESINDVKIGQKIKATVVSADENGVVVGLGSKKDGYIPKEEACLNGEYNPADFEIGTDVEVKVLSYDKEKFIVSKKAIDSLKDVESKLESIKNGAEFSLQMTAGKGGLFGRIGNFKVFVPASQIRIGFVAPEKMKDYEKEPLTLKVITVVDEVTETGAHKRELIASHRVIAEAERAAKKAQQEAERAKREEEFFASIEVNQVVTGRVQRMTEFGAFVRVNGFDCLAHITDLSWTRIEKPEDVLEIGKDYDFVVLKISKETKKVSLGYKQLQPKPWDLAAEKYPVGSVVKGTVVRLAPFGAFVEIEKGIDALVHVSEASHNWVSNINEVLKVGDEVEAKVINLDSEQKKMNISIKALLPEPEVKVMPEKDRPEKKERVRKPKKEDDGLHEWVGGSAGASIKDMLGDIQFDFSDAEAADKE